MKIAYVFATSGHTVSYKLGKMILPQLEQDVYGADVVGMFFVDDTRSPCARAIRSASGCRRSRTRRASC